MSDHQKNIEKSKNQLDEIAKKLLFLSSAFDTVGNFDMAEQLYVLSLDLEASTNIMYTSFDKDFIFRTQKAEKTTNDIISKIVNQDNNQNGEPTC